MDRRLEATQRAGCPDDETLIALVEAHLPEGRLVEIESHVDSCGACRQVVAALAEGGMSTAPGLALGTRPRGDEVAALAAGTVVATRYRIERPIGRGGMATVYLARDLSLDREIAIKIHHSPSGDARVQQEAVAMARLAHPNVVNVFEIGSIDARRFVAMEYIRGGTSRDWLATHRDVREIVALFVAAGEGLAAAHAAGLVHRDFKPENLLVGDDGRPRVTDFGLVQAQGSQLTPPPAGPADAVVHAPLTETGAIVGTPAYMAPEQLVGERVDARCDQFSFCVSVWEAIFGERPFAGTTLAAIHAAIERQELRAPTRTDVPARVRRVLERGLAANVGDRYADMPALLAALRRAVARGKTLRWIAIGCAVALVIGGGAAVYGYTRGSRELLERCPTPSLSSVWDATRRAGVERAFAATGRSYAGALKTDALAAVDHFATAWQAQARDACVAFEVEHRQDAALHDRRTACLEEARVDLASVVDRLLEIDGDHVVQTGRLVGSLPELSQCARADGLAAVDSATDPARRDKLASYFTQLAHVSSLAFVGRYDEASVHVAALVQAARDVGSRRDQAEAGFLAGQITEMRGQHDEATKLFEDALWVAEAAGSDVLVASIAAELMENLGAFAERYDDAQKYRQLAVAAAERTGSVDKRASVLRAIGLVEVRAGHFDAAEKPLREALALREGMGGYQHDTALVLSDLVEVATGRGQLKEAEALAQRAYDIDVAELGGEHPMTLNASSALATAWAGQGRFDEARARFEQVLEVTERTQPADSEAVAASLTDVGTTALQVGAFDRARQVFERALAIVEKTNDPEHPSVALELTNLGEVARFQGRLDDAARLHSRALEIRRKRLGEHHPDVTNSMLAMAYVTFAQRSIVEATVWCARARASLVDSDAGNVALLAEVEACRGTALLDQGRAAAAVPILEHALALLDQSEDTSVRPMAQLSLARALPASAVARAIELARAAREAFAQQGVVGKEYLDMVDAWLRDHGASGSNVH